MSDDRFCSICMYVAVVESLLPFFTELIEVYSLLCLLVRLSSFFPVLHPCAGTLLSVTNHSANVHHTDPKGRTVSVHLNKIKSLLSACSEILEVCAGHKNLKNNSLKAEDQNGNMMSPKAS